MFYIVTASSDTYITNKIIDNSFRATDSNVGRAGTLDLFKLYDESTYMSASTRVTSSVDEISRILVKFDYDTIQTLTSSSLDFTNSSFKAVLELFEVQTGAPVPRDFWVVSYPLAKRFSEGSGRDVMRFADVDAANFVTASYSSGSPILWNTSGSAASGYLGDSSLDYILSGTVGSSVIDFGSSQYFDGGIGKISLDVTNIVSCSLANIVSNHGFRISFSGSYETDAKTRFAKRFASRHVKNKLLAPRLLLTWDNSIRDSHLDFVFNTSSSLFLQNTVGGTPANLRSGSNLTQLRGQDCLLLTLVSGSGTTASRTYITASQHTGSATGTGQTGIYSASFALNMFDASFFKTMRSNDELELTEIWSSMDRTIGYFTGSLKVKKASTNSSSAVNRKLLFTALNVQPKYKQYARVKIKLFIEDINAQRTSKAYKLPRELETITVNKAFYRIRDIETNTILVPFDDIRNSTALSSDASGMFIDFRTAGLPLNRNYTIDLLVKDRGLSEIIPLDNISFRVTT